MTTCYPWRGATLILCRFVSVSVAVLALVHRMLGEGYSVSSGPWCWIKDCPNHYTDRIPPVAWGPGLIFYCFVAVSVAVLALVHRMLGEGYSVSSGPWCWIKDCPNHYNDRIPPVAWMAITGKAWEMTTYLVTCALYMLLKYFQWRKQKVKFVQHFIYMYNEHIIMWLYVFFIKRKLKVR